MKKIISILMLTVFLITGCTGNASSSQNGTTGAENTQNNECFYVINDAKIVPGTDFSEAFGILGEPVKYTEAASCYYEGMDKIYSYDGFEITTYPVKEKDFVQDINISSDKYKTTEGITVGSTLKEVTDAYGEDYELTGKMYRYFYNDNLYMYFFINNDVVKFFGYAIEAEN